MNSLNDILIPQRVVCRGHLSSKKKVLELASELLAVNAPAVSQTEVFASLCDRERLGSTGLGQGVAIPHGRSKNLDAAACAFVRLTDGVDYDAPDGAPVDLICALLVPAESTDEHLGILAFLAEMFSDQGFCQQLRAARSPQDVFALITSWRGGDLERAAGPSG